MTEELIPLEWLVINPKCQDEVACPQLTPVAAWPKRLAEAGQLLRTEAFARRVAQWGLRQQAGANTSPGLEDTLAFGFAPGSRLARYRAGWLGWAALGASRLSLPAEGGIWFPGRAGRWRRAQLAHQWLLPGDFQPDPHPCTFLSLCVSA